MGTHKLPNPNNKFALRRWPAALLLLILCASLLSACTPPDLDPAQLWQSPSLKDPETSQEHHGDIVASVAPDQVLSQGFLSRRPRLDGLELWLQLGPDAEPADGTLWFELTHTLGDTQPLVSRPISFRTIADNSLISIRFDPLDAPPDRIYYLSLKSYDGTVHVMGRSEDIYAPGELYLNAVPVDADLGFRASYRYGPRALVADLGAMFRSIWLVLPLLLVLWLPGALALEWLAPERLGDWGARLALSVALSLALIPLLMLWTSIVGLRWSREALWVAGVLLAGLYLWRLHRRGLGLQKLFSFDWLDLALAAVFFGGLLARLAMVRDLAAPAWVDSVHHGMLTRLILETGGFPDSYAPFMDAGHASYHIGFHSALAAFQWLSALELQRGMLLYGQVLNALSVFAVYLLTKTFTRSRLAGLFAALLTGLFSPMPAYYASWGRYTQLAGLLILPGVFALVARLWPRLKNSPSSESTPTQPLRWVLLAALASAGLALTHYRVSAFLAVLLLAAWITYNARALWLGRLRRTLGPSLGWVLLVALLAALLTLPWWPETLSGLLAPTSSKMGAVNQRPEFFAGFAWNLLTAASGRLVLVLAGLGLALAVILRRWFWTALVLWVAGLFLLSNMATLGLPAFNLINNLSVEIALFLPLCLLGGFLVTWPLEALAGRLPAPLKPPYWLAAALASCILALYAARALLPILNPITLLFRAADRPAIGWVDQNLPEDAHLLINPFLWGYGIYAGADGGAWIPALAGRAALPPPVLYGTAANAADRDAVITASSRVLDLSQDPQGLHAHLRELGIDYVFLGERGGVLSPRILQDSPLFELRYAQDGAWVFELR